MADLITKYRTNYFCVLKGSEEELAAITNRINADGEVQLLRRAINNRQHFAITINGNIIDEDDPKLIEGVDELMEALQQLLPPHQAVILFSIGYEGMSSLHSAATIVTDNCISDIDMLAEVTREANIMLGTTDYKPIFSY